MSRYHANELITLLLTVP